MSQIQHSADWINQECQQPNTGYVVLSEQMMSGNGFFDFLTDHFRLIATITQDSDIKNSNVRLLLRSDLLTEGFGQYGLDISRGKDDYRVIKRLYRIYN